MKAIPEHLWISLLVSLNGERGHDTSVVRSFCRFYRYSSRQVWDQALAEARQAADLEPQTVLH